MSIVKLLMMKSHTVHLLGDAILDNFYWLEDKARDLKSEISSLGYNVHNYAADDTKVSDLIKGLKPRDIYRATRSYEYPLDSDNKIYPLRLLSQNTGINRSFSSIYGIKPVGIDTRPEHIAVISMGGIDLGSKIMTIILGMDRFMNSVLTKEFLDDYDHVITSARNSCDKIILVSTYLPYLGKGSSYAKYSRFAKPVMDRWHEFLYQTAKKHNIPVLDLSRTLNPENRSHYGSDETRVSNISNKCMAKCIAHIHNNYIGHRIYFAPDCDFTKITSE